MRDSASTDLDRLKAGLIVVRDLAICFLEQPLTKIPSTTIVFVFQTKLET